MKTFKDCTFKHSYKHIRGDNPITEFLVPALELSVLYQRASGYFSSRILSQLAPGIAQLLQNGGKMQLVTSHAFTPVDAEAVENLESNSELEASLVEAFEGSVQEITSEIEKHNVRAMLWMLSHGHLEIKIVIPKHRLTGETGSEVAMYHPKFGILTDSSGDQVAFAGSLNETVSGWLSNIENLNVYTSGDATQNLYLEDYKEEFQRYWLGDAGRDWVVLNLPEAVAKRVIQSTGMEEPNSNTGRISTVAISEVEDGLRTYQRKALAKWVEAGRVGLLQMATGTGKTRTAMACIQNCLDASDSLLTVVIAPYQHIADQWAKELANIRPFEVSASTNWRKDLQEMMVDLTMGRYKNLTIVVVKNTAGSADFSSAIERLRGYFEHFLVIGDEVHWLGAPAYRAALSEKADWRLGLSATPQRYFDDEGSKFLEDYFRSEGADSSTVFEFTLGEALKFDDPITGQKILAPYTYVPVFIELTPEEQEDYDSWTRSIAKYSNRELTPEESQKLNEYRNARAMVLKKAANKISAFRDKVRDLGVGSLDFSLVYCSESTQMEKVASLLSDLKVDFSRITSAESARPSRSLGGRSEREMIIDSFARGRVNTLLSIDCLDEGVDIPPARAGFILASSGNPKEFIQRRGRLMRQFPGKDRADIYDFVALPHASSGDTSFTSELRRIYEFSLDALNRDEIQRTLQVRFNFNGEEVNG